MESNPGRGSRYCWRNKRQDGGTIPAGCMDTMGELYEKENKLFWDLVRSVYDVLPSPANLFTCGQSGIPSCPFCAGRGTQRHIMSAYPRVQGDGRYCWRHDLRTIADTVDEQLQARGETDLLRQSWRMPFSHSARKINSYLLCTTRYWRVENRYWGTIESFGVDRNYPGSGFNFLVNRNKAGCTDRTDSPVGGKYRSSQRKKAWKVSGDSITMQIQQMADMLADRNWLPGFRRKIFMQNSETTRYDRRKKRKAIRAISESDEKASRWI